MMANMEKRPNHGTIGTSLTATKDPKVAPSKKP